MRLAKFVLPCLALLATVPACRPLLPAPGDPRPWLKSAAPEVLPVKAAPALELQPEETVVGYYAVDGDNPSGSTYSGMARVLAYGDTYVVEYATGGKLYLGAGLLRGDQFSVGWAADGRGTGVTVYTVKAGGLLEGVYCQAPTDRKTRRETLRRLVPRKE